VARARTTVLSTRFGAFALPTGLFHECNVPDDGGGGDGTCCHVKRKPSLMSSLYVLAFAAPDLASAGTTVARCSPPENSWRSFPTSRRNARRHERTSCYRTSSPQAPRSAATPSPAVVEDEVLIEAIENGRPSLEVVGGGIACQDVAV
jgi:hypothetical protein